MEQNDTIKSVKNNEIEEEKWRWKKWTFFLLDEKFSYSLYKSFKLREFQICNHLFYIFTGTKVTAFQSRLKMPILGCFWLTLTSCIFWSSKDIKKMVTYLKLSRFEVFVQWIWKFFVQQKKSSFFSSSFFFFIFIIFHTL